MVGEGPHVALAGGVAQRLCAADRLIDAYGGVDRPRHQRECGDGLPTEGQALWGDRVRRAAVGEPFVGGRGLENRHLFLEDRAVVEVIRGVVVADVDPEDV